MKRPMRERQPGHHTTPAFTHEQARRLPTPALLPRTTRSRMRRRPSSRPLASRSKHVRHAIGSVERRAPRTFRLPAARLRARRFRFSGAFLAPLGGRFGLLEPSSSRTPRSTEPKVRGSNPRGRAPRLATICLQAGGFAPDLMSSPDGNTGGNGAALTGAGEDLASGGLPPRIALGRGLPGGWPAAQAVGVHVSRGARDQDPAHRRGGIPPRWTDAAQLRARVGRPPLRRARRQRRHQRPHPSRVPAAADHLRAGLLRAW
jgi:hypothetical protein